jgi:hypothetical protein
MRDASAQLRFATRRAKSDVANKLVSMFLHELSRQISRDWELRVDGERYETAVREVFQNRCPYCLREISGSDAVIEHLDGMNRYRLGLHVVGNVLVACRRCNSEKRRDDSQQALTLADTGWESFLLHDGTRCPLLCRSCLYWKGIWQADGERAAKLAENLGRIRSFRDRFPEFKTTAPFLKTAIPEVVAKLYTDCQAFAESEIKVLLGRFEEAMSSSRNS